MTPLLILQGVFGLDQDCIRLEEAVPKAEIGDAFSNTDQIVLNAHDDSRVTEFTTCVDKSDMLVGVQFVLYSEENEATLRLDPLGRVEGDDIVCRTLELTSPFDKIRASFLQEK